MPLHVDDIQEENTRGGSIGPRLSAPSLVRLLTWLGRIQRPIPSPAQGGRRAGTIASPVKSKDKVSYAGSGRVSRSRVPFPLPRV